MARVRNKFASPGDAGALAAACIDGGDAAQ